MKAIPNRALGKDVSRVAWIWFKFPSELPDDNAYILELAPSISLPDGLREASMRERFVGVSDQALQNEKLFWGQVAHTAARTSDLVGLEVDRTIMKDNLIPPIIRACHAPQDSSHPSQQLLQHERL
jgi:hypothetical protein